MSGTRCGFRGCGGAVMPRSRGAVAVGCGRRARASGVPFGVAGIPRSAGATPRFFVIALDGIAYTLRTSRRDDSRAREGGIWQHGPGKRAREAVSAVRRPVGNRPLESARARAHRANRADGRPRHGKAPPRRAPRRPRRRRREARSAALADKSRRCVAHRQRRHQLPRQRSPARKALRTTKN